MRISPSAAIPGVLLVGLLAGATAPAVASDSAPTKKCLFVSSYQRGYQHADDIEQGVRSVLAGKCEIKQVNMDTKVHKSEAEKKARALIAKAMIETWKPDIVITADDNAAKYLIKPYYENVSLPFVFCGLNWTAAEYGFPLPNVTGMIEVAPILPMLRRAQDILPSVKRVFYVGADVLSEEKNLKRFQRAAQKLGFKLDYALAPTTDAWLAAYRRAQDYDLVVMGSRNGIKDWDHDRAIAGVLRYTRRLSVTNHGWMMPYTALGMTKVSREQGEWAAKAALRILGGMQPTDIPIVPNRRRDIWINKDVLEAAHLTLPADLMRKGKKVASIRN